MKNKNNDEPEITEQYIQQLQDELAAATERSRLAKRAVKDAKAEAKLAKRDKKQARKVLIAAQSALEEKAASAAGSERIIAALTDATHLRIPDSPETRRKRRRRSRPEAAAASPAADASSPAESPDQAPATLVK